MRQSGVAHLIPFLLVFVLLIASCVPTVTQEEEEEATKSEQKMIRYFAYGSNMDKEDLDRWCTSRGFPLVKFLSVSPAELDGHRLCFNYFSASRNGGAANIMESDEDHVFGLLIEIEERDLETIRTKEGYPNFYTEISVDVQRLDGTVVQDVITYKVVKSREEPSHQPPTRDYLSLIIRSARRYNFPADYVNYLQLIKTID